MRPDAEPPATGRTPLGTLGSGPIAWVDERGTVEASQHFTRWWVRAEDRWHRNDTDAAVRQRLVDFGPVVETSMRVPGGDVVMTTYAIATDGPPVVVARLTNTSPLPVAVALVVDSADELVARDSVVARGDDVVVRSSRAHRQVIAADSLDALLSTDDHVHEDMSPTHGRFLAAVAPLPHAQTLRWCWGSQAWPRRLAEPEEVAAGWTQQTATGAQLVLPPPNDERFEEARRFLALGLGDDVGVADRVRRLHDLLALGWFEAAVDETERLRATRRWRGDYGDHRTTAMAGAVLSRWGRAGLPPSLLAEVRGARLQSATLEGGAGPAERGVVSELIDGVIDETPDGLHLLSGWAGQRQPFEGHGVPTRYGLASVALRWHGERPALLWGIERWPQAGSAGQPTVRAPALDSTWQAVGGRGEALLAEPPALATPTVTTESFG